MEAEDIRVIDIASELQISSHTVSKFLRGERVNRANKAAIEGYLSRKASSKTKAKAVAG